MNINEAIRCGRLYFDGGMGTELIKRGLKAGECSESANFRHPDWVVDIHKAYIAAGANIIKTNTFGVNSLKYENYGEYIERAVLLAMDAVGNREDVYVALDIGPCGLDMYPLGDSEYDDSYEFYKKFTNVLDTSFDTLELKTQYERVLRSKFSFKDKRGFDYTLAVINVNFNYKYRFNRNLAFIHLDNF